MERDMSRRTFVGATTALAVSGIASRALASEGGAEEVGDASATADGFPEGMSTGWLTDDPQRYADRGGTTLTLEQLNKIRRDMVDAAHELTASDGTTAGETWVRLATLMNTYGGGLLKAATPEEADEHLADFAEYLQNLFDDDEEAARHCLEMPWGKVFSVYEYAEASGRTVEECAAICGDLAARGLICHLARTGGDYYHHLPIYHGFWEYSVGRIYDPKENDVYVQKLIANGASGGVMTSGTPIYYSVPCDKDVVADDRVLPCNDWEEMLDRYDTICVLPCICSLTDNVSAGADVPPIGSEELKEFRNVFESEAVDGQGHHLERCLGFGEEAEYYLERGLARKISKDEAREIIQRNIDEGLVMQMGYTRNSEILCSCHSACCKVLSGYAMLGPDVFPQLPISVNCSNYLLNYDRDACIQCGACVERCPMHAISMDDTNHPAVNALCVRCGQCGLVCPVHARTLSARPAEDRLPVPDDHMDDHNRKFGFRVEHGLV
ncbi:4Fe-4S binding protein [bacterium]|nr:4Fe-4S binding protein [bacterium]